MNRMMIDYLSDDNKNLSGQIMKAVFRVLKLNRAECTGFSLMGKTPVPPEVFEFMKS